MKYKHQRIFLILVALATTSAPWLACLADDGNSNTMENYEHSITQQGGYLDQAIAHKDEQEGKVNELLGKLPPPPADPGNDHEFDEYLNQFPKIKNFQGASPEDFAAGIAEDEAYVTGPMFTQCQGNNYPHTYANIMQPISSHMDGAPPFWSNVCFSWHWEYPLGYQTTSGECVIPIGYIPYCGIVLLWSDLVAYNFPTHKIDVSEQPYQSLYINDVDAKINMAGNEELLATSGAAEAISNAATTLATGRRELLARHIEPGPQIPYDAALFQALGEMTANGAMGVAHEALDARSDLPEKFRHMAGDQSRAYSRNVTDALDTLAGRSRWIPHRDARHYFGTDMPEGFPAGFMLGKSLTLSGILSDKFDTYFGKDGNPGVTDCIANNKRTGKTPLDLFPGVEAAGGPPPNDICLDNIGERFPPNETRRMHITDRTVRAIAANIDLFQVIIPEGQRHSFHENEDLFLPLRNKAFVDEAPKCVKLKDLAKVNTTFNKANVKEIGTGGENAVEVFTAFRGCWGWKGTDEGSAIILPFEPEMSQTHQLTRLK